jgi:hypothetical protein
MVVVNNANLQVRMELRNYSMAGYTLRIRPKIRGAPILGCVRLRRTHPKIGFSLLFSDRLLVNFPYNQEVMTSPINMIRESANTRLQILYYLASAVLFILAFLLRFARLGGPSLWIDEAFVGWFTGNSWSGLLYTLHLV